MSYPARTHAHSEATRLLCAGVRLNSAFRQRVIDELIGHAERPVPPSLGVDLRPVLAHALQARRQEVRTALALLGVWAAFFVVSLVVTYDMMDDLSGGNWEFSFDALLALVPAFEDPALGSESLLATVWVVQYVFVVLALWAGRALSGRRTVVYDVGREDRWQIRSRARRWLGRLVTYVARVFALWYWFGALGGVDDNPFPVIFPLLLAGVVWLHRIRMATVLREQLGRRTFHSSPLPELPVGARYRAVGEAIDREQHAQAAMYDPNRPFVGAGTPYKPWSFALELRRKKDLDGGGVPHQGESGLSSRQVIDMITPRLVALREAAARTSRDRLRELEVEEFVYLPSGAPRDGGVYGPESVHAHLGDAVDEGAEARRHFLRIRVGAWEEQVVVSLFVRVHTQGGMLVLEVVPHVLGPVAEEFREVDAMVESRAAGPLREGFLALLTAPAVTAAAGIAAMRTLFSVCRVWLAAPEYAAPDAPLLSVRELASTPELSLFQEMDVSRYIKTVQDRIAGGVRDALEQRGFRTDRFEQQIVNVRDGGVFIKEISGGTVATGEHGQAHHVEGSPK
ncbi:hypothetical protein [Streptomyces albidus (ex Kaewkla and Franco 2022)]|uniref:hypothetical protein n=1 Tax=Streptomyces albidus (ex Kaewkla and Franco 2022) TaxID=722709 RepID=UPI0015EF858C|nr:hypothetical protein [Streptomyces albidus (ex Kaewkla and Franco 2022)]